MGLILECLDSERQIQLLVQTDLSFQSIVYTSNSSLISNILGNKYDSTLCSTLLLCYVTIFYCFRLHYSVRAVKYGEKKKVNS